MSNNKTESTQEETASADNLTYDEILVKLQATEQKATEYWERILRMQAESDNALRRAERDVANAHKFALEKFVNELIPIIDSLELCLANETDHDDTRAASIVEGVGMTLKMFYAAIEKFGVKQVNPISQIFDPEFEQAISVQMDSSVPPNTVLSVLQKGYTLNSRLIRPALVVVSKAEE